MREVMDAITDPGVHTVTLKKSAQIGGTEVLLNALGFHAHLDPCPILLVEPTLEIAESYSKDRLAPMIRDCPALSEVFLSSRAKGDDSLRHKKFAGGHVTLAGANSPSSLASRPIRKVFFDEVSRYPESAGEEGDPVALGNKRTNNYWNRQTVLVSTPTTKGRCRISESYDESDQRRYFVPCPECGHMHVLEWKLVVFSNRAPETVQMACPSCGVLYDEPWDKQAWLESGEWRATRNVEKDGKSDPGHAGFHINELYSVWKSWKDMVAEFLSVCKKKRRLQVWTNTSLGEEWTEDEEEPIDVPELMDRCEPYVGVPDGVLVLTAAVDVQGDRFEVEVVGWGRDYESWGIEYSVLWGSPAVLQSWQELDDYLMNAKFKDRFGVEFPLRAVAVDSGGQHTQMVYRYTKGRWSRRVFAVKGVGGPGQPLLSKPVRKSSRKVKLFMVGSNTAKDDLFAWLRVEEPGPGYCHFPTSYPAEYFEQWGNERVATRYRAGVRYKTYEKVSESARNEAIDLRQYNLAALELVRPAWDMLQRRLEQKRCGRRANVEEVEPEEVEEQQQEESATDDSVTDLRRAPVRVKRRGVRVRQIRMR